MSLVGQRRAAITHGDGSFHLTNVRDGSHTIRVERLGYATATVVVDVEGETEIRIVELQPSALDIGGLVVTGSLTERSADEALRPVNVVRGEELQRRLQGTVAATLKAEPGLASTSMGPATAQPVIRGLSGDRVLMLEDGARVGDVSNGGQDHATALDPASARRIEVVRGPAALLYGSSALGGVINVIRDEIPAAVPHHLTGSATLQSQTVNDAFGGSVSSQLPLGERLALRMEATGRTTSDMATPVGILENTQLDTWSAGAGASFVEDWGHVGGAVRHFRNDYGIPGGFVGGHEDGVRIQMERTSSKVRGLVEDGLGPFSTVQVDGTYTWYRHKEIEPPNILGTLFQREVVSGDVLARHESWGPFASGAVGARASWEDFQYGGALFTPDSRRVTLAAYLMEEIDLDPLRIEAALRYDRVRVTPEASDPTADIGPIAARTFGAASGSLGLLFDAGAGFTLGASVARAFRTPDIGELYSQGPHLAAYAYEVGNPLLGNEIGTGVDVFARFGSDRVSGEVTVFRNDISGFIYGEETGEISRVQLPIYQFQSNDAVLVGLEGGLEWSVLDDLLLEATSSWVRGTLETSNEPLPLIPPLQGRVALEYEPTSWFVRGEVEMAARQDRLGEFETVTPGYQVFHAAAGVRLTVGGRLNVLTLSVENVTDQEYRNHLSRVKEIMPEAGRGVSLTYRVVF
ncbi:MAG: TonB-dependent receptor [Longimicrobiales bacterium]|nr:TonB-dependent receptor [Longimicrobiales bacterium]